MAYRNKMIVNPKTGQNIKFILTSKETRGSLLEMEASWQPHSVEPPMHYHPSQTEHFIVMAGELTIKMDGVIKYLKPGARLEIPARTAHAMWNSSDDITIVNWKVLPALDADQLFETGMGLANDGKVNEKGMPAFLQTIIMVNHFSHVFRLAKPSFFIQRILFAILTPVAWLRGYRATYKKYID